MHALQCAMCPTARQRPRCCREVLKQALPRRPRSASPAPRTHACGPRPPPPTSTPAAGACTPPAPEGSLTPGSSCGALLGPLPGSTSGTNSLTSVAAGARAARSSSSAAPPLAVAPVGGAEAVLQPASPGEEGPTAVPGAPASQETAAEPVLRPMEATLWQPAQGAHR